MLYSLLFYSCFQLSSFFNSTGETGIYVLCKYGGTLEYIFFKKERLTRVDICCFLC